MLPALIKDSFATDDERQPALIVLLPLIAVVYAVLGRLALLLAIPPGYASAIFPSSGVALAVLLVYGNRVWPAICLGSLGLNLWLADANLSSTSLAIAAGISVGATLQAVVAAALVRKTVAAPFALNRETDVLKFMLCGGPLACVINASIGPCTLLVAGAIGSTSYFDNSLTWWIGDTLGVIVVAPFAMIWIARPRELWRQRRIFVGAPLATAFSITTAFFLFTSHSQQNTIKLQFEGDASDLAVAIRRSFDGYIDMLGSFERHISLSPQLDRQIFHDLVTPAFSRHPGIYALTWVRRVAAKDLPAFEQYQQQSRHLDFHVIDVSSTPGPPSLGTRATYLPVTYVEPAEHELSIMGLDMASDPRRFAAFTQAEEGGAMVALTGIRLSRDPSAKPGMILTQPVFATSSPPLSVEARRAQLLGFINCAVRISDAIQTSLTGLNASGIDFRLRDRTLPLDQQILYDSSSTAKTAPQHALAWTSTFQAVGRTFELEFFPNKAYDPTAKGLSAWAFMVCGLLFCGLLSAFLLVVTGRSVLVEAMITDRTKALTLAQTKAQAGEARYRSLMQSTHDAIVATDDLGNVVSWNVGAERLFQHSEAKALGQPLASMLASRDQGAYNAAFKRAVTLRSTAASVSPMELHGYSLSGEEFPIELSLASWENEGRTHVTAVIRDISARKEAERVAAEDRSVLASFFANSPQMMAVVDTSDEDYWHISANHATASVLAVTAQQLCAASAKARGTPPELLAAWLDEFAKSRLDAKPVSYEFSRLINAETRWFQAIINYVGPSGPNRQRHCYSVFDITDRIAAERKLRGENVSLERRLTQKAQHVDDAISALLESEANFRFLAESIPQLVWTTGADGIADFYNKRWFDYTGDRDVEAAHANNAVVHEDDRAAVVPAWQECIDGLKPFDMEYRLRRSDGQYRWHLTRATPLVDAATKTARWFGTSTDIHDQKAKTDELLTARTALLEMEQEQATLAVRENAALESSRLKSEFLASMSHEIRTPINGVIGMTRLLLDTPLNSEQRDFAEAVKRSGDSLLTVINDILDFSKIEAGKLDFEQIPFPLARTLEDAILPIQYMAQKKQLLLETVFDQDVPPAVIGDPGRLRQVITNLLSNAVKFTKVGSVVLRTKLLSSDSDHIHLRFEVQDTGIGIAAEARHRLFQSFSQADSSTTRQFGGTGLGLSISKHLVERMGGEIGVESTYGEGSLFWFTVVLGVSADAVLLPQAMGPTEPVMIGARRTRILVAEDVQINQIIALRMLEKLGCTAHAVASGKEAVEALQNFDYDLVFMDCHMPEMDGYEATQVIRASRAVQNPRVPIIAMTANAMKGDREKCLAVGMDDYISKPVHPEALHAVVRKWLSPSVPSIVASNAEVVMQEFDAAELDRLDDMGDSGDEMPSLAIEVSNAFVEQMPNFIAGFRVADVASAWETLALNAHSLKSSAASVGLHHLSQSCARLEKLAREAVDADAARLEIVTLIDLAGRAKDLLAADLAVRLAKAAAKMPKAG